MDLFEFDSTVHGVNATIWALTRLMEYYNGTFIEEEKPSLISIINLYFTFPIVILGTIGNLLSIAVFQCTKLRRISASYYLTMLSISDTLFLVTWFALWLDQAGIPTYNKPILCQFITYLTYVSCFLSPWLIVIFTVERFVATCYPLWRAVICTVARAKAIVLSLAFLASLSYLYIPVVIGLEPENTSGTYQCKLKLEYHYTMGILNIVDTGITMVLPVILIIVLNIQIVRAIWHYEYVRRRMTMVSVPSDECNSNSVDMSYAVQLNATVGKGASGAVKHGISRSCYTQYQVKITKMLLIISSVFIGLNAPSYVIRLMVYFMSDKEAEKYINIHMWCQLGYILNFAINFLLYCVSGQNFRKSLKSLLWKIAHKAKHRKLSRSNTGTMITNCNNSTVNNHTMAIGLITTSNNN